MPNNDDDELQHFMCST